MKKALQISIAKTLFTIEEDAYSALDNYLSSIKKHFQNTKGGEEIISDIESRIAEEFLDSKEKVVTLPQVEKILEQMGKVEDFGDEEKEAETKEEERSKKLYRNPDNAIIGGVSSGLAAFFGIETVWVRVAFALLTLANGFGILLYIILWIAMPEAKTNAQKLEMSGSPVTITTLSETVKERVGEMKERGNIGNLIRNFFSFAFNALRIFIGIIFAIVATSILVAILFSIGVTISDEAWIAVDVSLSSLLPGELYWIVLSSLALAILIPSLFLLFSAISILQKKSVLTSQISWGLAAVWFVSLATLGFGGAKAAGNYEDFVKDSVVFQEVERDIPLSGEFTKLEISNGMDIDIFESTSTSLVATGRERDIDSLDVKIENGTLILKYKSSVERRICILCFNDPPDLILRIPSLTEVSARHGSYVTMRGNEIKFAATLEHGSVLDASDFTAQEAEILARHGSRAELNVAKILKATAEHGSIIEYIGSPQVTKIERPGSRIRARDEI